MVSLEGRIENRVYLGVNTRSPPGSAAAPAWSRSSRPPTALRRMTRESGRPVKIGRHRALPDAAVAAERGTLRPQSRDSSSAIRSVAVASSAFASRRCACSRRTAFPASRSVSRASSSRASACSTSPCAFKRPLALGLQPPARPGPLRALGARLARGGAARQRLQARGWDPLAIQPPRPDQLEHLGIAGRGLKRARDPVLEGGAARRSRVGGDVERGRDQAFERLAVCVARLRERVAVALLDQGLLRVLQLRHRLRERVQLAAVLALELVDRPGRDRRLASGANAFGAVAVAGGRQLLGGGVARRRELAQWQPVDAVQGRLGVVAGAHRLRRARRLRRCRRLGGGSGPAALGAAADLPRG